eukprot:g2445.t1
MGYPPSFTRVPPDTNGRHLQGPPKSIFKSGHDSFDVRASYGQAQWNRKTNSLLGQRSSRAPHKPAAAPFRTYEAAPQIGERVHRPRCPAHLSRLYDDSLRRRAEGAATREAQDRAALARTRQMGKAQRPRTKRADGTAVVRRRRREQTFARLAEPVPPAEQRWRGTTSFVRTPAAKGVKGARFEARPGGADEDQDAAVAALRGSPTVLDDPDLRALLPRPLRRPNAPHAPGMEMAPRHRPYTTAKGLVFWGSGPGGPSGAAVGAAQRGAVGAMGAAAAAAAAPARPLAAARILSRFYHLVHDRTSMLRVRDIFLRCDADGNGRVTRQELATALPLLKVAVTAGELAQVWPLFDRDGNGTLDHAEFEAIVREHAREHMEVVDHLGRRVAGGAGPSGVAPAPAPAAARPSTCTPSVRGPGSAASSHSRSRRPGTSGSAASGRATANARSGIRPGMGGFKLAFMQRPVSPWRQSHVSEELLRKVERDERERKGAYFPIPKRSLAIDHLGRSC